MEKLHKAIDETKGLDVVKAGQYTLGQWMRVWYENYATVKVRPSSHATYMGIIKNYIDPAIGQIPAHNPAEGCALLRLERKEMHD